MSSVPVLIFAAALVVIGVQMNDTTIMLVGGLIAALCAALDEQESR